MFRLTALLTLLALPVIAQTVQIDVPIGVYGSISDVASVNIMRYMMTPGGAFGDVNGVVRATDVIYPGVTSQEWSITGINYNYSASAIGVALYGQSYAFSTGGTFAGVLEAHAQAAGGTAVALEVDGAAVAGAVAVGIDCVNYGNLQACMRCQEGQPCIVDSTKPGSYIAFDANGHFVFYANGVLVNHF